MANSFTITISAVDRATATVRAVNQSIGRLTRPISQLGASGRALTREMGLERVGRSMAKVGRAALDVAENVRRVAAPLAAIAGIGSVAGIAALATNWAHLGSEINRSSAAIGISGDRLQSLRGAARLAGVSAESLTQGMKTFGDSMQDALYGRNQDALVMLGRLGITLKRTASGAVDTAGALGDVADAIQRAPNAQVQNLIARTLGVEELLPMLRQGRKGIEAYEQRARSFGATMSGPLRQQADAFRMSLVDLGLAGEGLKNAIGAQLLPVFRPIIDALARWIAANRDLIATRVGEFVREVGASVRQIDWAGVVHGVKSFAGGVVDLVDKIGGWKVALIGVLVVMNAGLIAGVLSLTTAIVSLGAAALPVLISGLGLLASVIPGVTVVFAAVGAAIAATPIGWMIAGIAGLGLAAYELYQHWDWISGWWSKLWAGMHNDAAKSWTKEELGLGGFQAAPNQPFKGFARPQQPGGAAGAAGGSGAPVAPPAGPRIGAPPPPLPGRDVGRSPGPGPRAEPAPISPYLLRPGDQPLGLRQNNPGNLRSWGNAPVENGFARFGTMPDGLRALIDNLIGKQDKHGLNTLGGIIGDKTWGWAPASDGNNVSKYLQDLYRSTGIRSTQRLDLHDPETLRKIVPGIIRKEQGQQPFAPELLDGLIRERLGTRPRGDAAPAAPSASPAAVKVDVNFRNAPAGMRAEVSAQGDARAAARIGYGMPSAVPV